MIYINTSQCNATCQLEPGTKACAVEGMGAGEHTDDLPRLEGTQTDGAAEVFAWIAHRTMRTLNAISWKCGQEKTEATETNFAGIKDYN